jgi:hypothetical protein
VRKQTARTKNSETKIVWALGFLGLLLLVILSSFIWKFISFLQQSTFDGAHQFTIVAAGEQTHIISFNPDQEAITVVDVLDNSQKNIGQSLEIPIDALVQTDETDINSLLFSSLLHHVGNLSPIDIMKLLWFTTTRSHDEISNQTLPKDLQQAQFRVSKLFQDKSLYTEGKSITIINATTTSGLGTRLAKLLTNIGANVIMVSTADKQQQKSLISYTDAPSYTGKRLEKILHIPLQTATTNAAISDITILIGKDLEKTEIF